MPLLKRTVIQEIRLDGFLQLVRKFAGQEDIGDMRLKMFDAVDGVRVRVWLGECGKQIEGVLRPFGQAGIECSGVEYSHGFAPIDGAGSEAAAFQPMTTRT